MNPLWFVARTAGVMLITAGGICYLAQKKLLPKTNDFATGAIHFQKGFNEFQKGFSTLLFGAQGKSPEEAKKEREAARIRIE
jgi:membrane-anchored protein YejM (alkaline phosphatase superfamily)